MKKLLVLTTVILTTNGLLAYTCQQYDSAGRCVLQAPNGPEVVCLYNFNCPAGQVCLPHNICGLPPANSPVGPVIG